MLSLAVNLIAAVSYLMSAADKIIWPVVGLIAVSSLIGGFIGSRIGRRLSPLVLRLVIVTLGTVALYFMVGKLLTS